MAASATAQGGAALVSWLARLEKLFLLHLLVAAVPPRCPLLPLLGHAVGGRGEWRQRASLAARRQCSLCTQWQPASGAGSPQPAPADPPLHVIQPLLAQALQLILIQVLQVVQLAIYLLMRQQPYTSCTGQNPLTIMNLRGAPSAPAAACSLAAPCPVWAPAPPHLILHCFGHRQHLLLQCCLHLVLHAGCRAAAPRQVVQADRRRWGRRVRRRRTGNGRITGCHWSVAHIFNLEERAP